MKRRILPVPVYNSNEIVKETAKRVKRRSLSRNERFYIRLVLWTVFVLSVVFFIWNIFPNQNIKNFQGNNLLFKLHTNFSLVVESNEGQIDISATSIVPFQIFSKGQLLTNAELPSDWIGNVSEYTVKENISTDTTLSVVYESSDSENQAYVLVELTSTDVVDITLIKDYIGTKSIVIGIFSLAIWAIVSMFIVLAYLD